MSAPFSWSDAFYATFGPCLSCLPTSHRSLPNNNGYENAHQALTHSDELEGLLQSDSEDALSLHSRLGEPRTNRRRKPKEITIFGYSLFGRRDIGPIYLPADGDGDGNARRPRRTSRSTASSTNGTSSYDQDAQQLSSSALDAMNPEELRARALALEEDERRTREEAALRKKERKRNRKEMKRVASLLASGAAGDGEDFEGFPGSGADEHYRHIPSPLLGVADDVPPRPGPYSPQDEDDDSADLDGALYSRSNRGGTSSNGGSDSRSRTSASRSQTYSNSPHSPLSPSYTPNESTPRPPKTKKRKSKSSRSSATASSTTTSSTSDPASEPLPRSPLSTHPEDFDGVPGGPFFFTELGGEISEFDGTPGGFDVPHGHSHEESGVTVTEGGFKPSGMPSPGLSGGRGNGVKDVNVFLGSGGF